MQSTPAKKRQSPFDGGALLVLAAMAVYSTTGTALAGEFESQQIKAVVQKHLRPGFDYRPGDLICRGDVEPIFNELIDRGLNASGDIEELYDSFLLDSSPLAQTLRTPAGRKFMRSVSSLPDAYDRMERLSWLPEGRSLLSELIASPEGPQLFQTLLEPENLKHLEQRMSNDPRGRNLRLPTGHVYTANQLLEHLKKTFSSPRGR